MYPVYQWAIFAIGREVAYHADDIDCSLLNRQSGTFYGAMKSQTPELSLAKQLRFLNQFVSLSFDDAAAQIFGEIRANLVKKGTPIGPYDLQIAAIAIANQVTLVTRNTAEFGRIPSLQVEDWE